MMFVLFETISKTMIPSFLEFIVTNILKWIKLKDIWKNLAFKYIYDFRPWLSS